MCVTVSLYVYACTYTRGGSSSSSTVLPPPFTNTCIILSGRKGPVSLSFLSSDTSQASKGVAEGLMTPLLKARTCLHGMKSPANYLIPSPMCHSGGRGLLCLCGSLCSSSPPGASPLHLTCSLSCQCVHLPVHQMTSACPP